MKLDQKQVRRFAEFSAQAKDIYEYLEQFENEADRQASQHIVELGNNVRKSVLTIDQLLHYLGESKNDLDVV